VAVRTYRGVSAVCTEPLITGTKLTSFVDWHAQTQHETKALLLAQDYDAISKDLRNGTVEILHPEMLPQRNR
jgi:hypothetical protein